MALKDRWSRMLRRSVSSSSSGGNDPSSTAATDTNPPSTGTSGSGGPSSPELAKAPSRLAKTLTWRSAKSDATTPKKKKKKEKPAKAAPPTQPTHPAERPLTETNLRHQELLSAFAMNFGRRRASQGGRTSYSNISPGGSRQGSVDASAMHLAHGHGHGHGSSLVREVPMTVGEGVE